MSRAYIDLRFAPHWELIDPAREFLLRFVAHTFRNEAIASQVSLAAHELLENAIKYSPNDEANIQIELEMDGSICLVVENEAYPEHVPILMEELRRIDGCDDLAGLYREKMDLAVTRDDGKSCLGLARIACEAEMKLDCSVEGSQVRMRATRTIARTELTPKPSEPGRKPAE